MVTRPRRRSALLAGPFRDVLLAGAVVLASGCLYVGSNAEQVSTTTLTAARTTTVPPPLAAFVVRVAEDEDALEPAKARAVEELVREVDEAVRPIEDARIVFVDVLARAMIDRRFMPASADAAADRFVRATEQAAPRLRSAVERLHAVLDMRERRALVEAVAARFERWERVWETSPGRTTEGHPWVGTLAGNSPATNEIARDAVTTARRWSAGLVAEVGALAEDPALDASARGQLASRLRATGRLQ